MTSRVVFFSLVADDEVRVHGKRPGDADPLALAATHFMGIAISETRVQAADVEQFANALPAFALVWFDVVDPQRFAQNMADLHARIERAIGILEDHLNAFAKARKVFLTEMGDVFAAEPDISAGRFFEPQNTAANRGLAATGFADQA